MSGSRQPTNPQLEQFDPIEHAVGLLSQEVWCWGRDVLRPEGNWLLELGFDRLEPPADRDECSSVYSLTLPCDQQIVLRGFGVIFIDKGRGSIFLPRYEFCPRYSTSVILEQPPWSGEDLPGFSEPGPNQRENCAAMLFGLIDWISDYEFNIVDKLGIEYRRDTLQKWNDGSRHFTQAENFALAWRNLASDVSKNVEPYLGDSF